MIATLAGGVGAARFLAGLVQVVDPATVTAIVNVGDDLVLHGLHVSPDLDTVTYTLAGAINPETGLGPRGRDLAGHGRSRPLRRPDLVPARRPRPGDPPVPHAAGSPRARRSPTVTAEIASALGTEAARPAGDRRRRRARSSPSRARATIGFQEYFVGRQHSVPVTRRCGSTAPSGHAGARRARRHRRRRRRSSIAPSNPIVSIGPCWPCPACGRGRSGPGPHGRGLPHRRRRRAQGPGRPPDARARARVVRRGRGPALRRRSRRALVIDEADAALAPAVEAEGVRASSPRRSCGTPEAAGARPGRRSTRRCRLEILGVEGIAEIRARRRPRRPHRAPRPADARTNGDVVVVTQKIVSKAEDRLVAVDPDDPLSHKALVEPSRCASCAAAASSSSARPRTGSCAPTPASTCRTSSGAGPRCCPTTPTARPAASATASGPAPASTSRSSCPTRSAGRGAGASPTSPSAAPASARVVDLRGTGTRSAASCRSPRWPSSTSWRPPPSW